MNDMQACTSCALPVGLCPYRGEHPVSPAAVASDQVVAALLDIERAPDSYVRWPYVILDALYGGMAPATVHYVVGFSGMGKSTFIASVIGRWVGQGRRVDVMPLETSAKTFRTYLACQEAGIDPGAMLSGDFWRWPNAEAVRATVAETLRAQMRGAFGERCYVHGVEAVTATKLRVAARDAAERGAEILVVDHIDHIEGDGERRASLYEQSVQVNRAALSVARDTGLVLVLMSQANQEALRGNPDHMAKYAALRDSQVLQGGHKRQVATGMLGIYRPLLDCPEGADVGEVAEWKEAVSRARRGEEPPSTALEPGAVGVNLMKSRNYGGREGQRVRLRWSAGRVVDPLAPLPYSLR